MADGESAAAPAPFSGRRASPMATAVAGGHGNQRGAKRTSFNPHHQQHQHHHVAAEEEEEEQQMAADEEEEAYVVAPIPDDFPLPSFINEFYVALKFAECCEFYADKATRIINHFNGQTVTSTQYVGIDKIQSSYEQYSIDYNKASKSHCSSSHLIFIHFEGCIENSKATFTSDMVLHSKKMSGIDRQTFLVFFESLDICDPISTSPAAAAVDVSAHQHQIKSSFNFTNNSISKTGAPKTKSHSTTATKPTAVAASIPASSVIGSNSNNGSSRHKGNNPASAVLPQNTVSLNHLEVTTAKSPSVVLTSMSKLPAPIKTFEDESAPQTDSIHSVHSVKKSVTLGQATVQSETSNTGYVSKYTQHLGFNSMKSAGRFLKDEGVQDDPSIETKFKTTTSNLDHAKKESNHSTTNHRPRSNNNAGGVGSERTNRYNNNNTSKFSGPRGGERNASSFNDQFIKMEVYISPLADDITEEELKASFSQFGEVKRVFSKPSLGSKPGFAHLRFSSEAEAQSAIKATPVHCKGNELPVKHRRRNEGGNYNRNRYNNNSNNYQNNSSVNRKGGEGEQQTL